MKIRYFGFHLNNSEDHTNSRVDLLPLLEKFCDLDEPDFKNSFSHNGEKVFLLKSESPVFVFVKTKDTEIIKAINRRSISTQEIADILEADESIGFSSYIYVGTGFLAYASTHLAPTVFAFSTLLNDLLTKLGYYSHRIQIMPIAESITRAEALSMAFIGSSLVSVNSTSSLFDEFKEVLGIEDNDAADIGTFEICIKPKHKRNIKPAIKNIIMADQTGMEKFDIRAKAEVHDRIADYRIERSLVESDEIKIKPNEDIASVIIKTVSSRVNFAQKVADHAAENSIENRPAGDFIELHTTADWNRRISGN